MKRFSLLLISFLTMSLLIIAQVKMFVHQKDGTLMSFLTYRVDSVGFVYSEVSDTPVVSGTKLYFINTPGWENIYVHIWSGATYEQYSAWPGVLANKEDIFIDGFEVYSFDMKGKEKYDKIIFNNGSGGEGNQTSDLNIDYNTPYFVLMDWYMSIDEIRKLTHNGRKLVDLGLPSGVLWATCNIGAEYPQEFGYIFNKWGYGSYSKYNSVDNKIILELSDDVANVNWGGEWRMPTKDEQKELLNECTWERTTINEVDGYTITGPNGNSIFMPIRQVGATMDWERYWSSSLNTDGVNCAYCLMLDRYPRIECQERNFECSVRPVVHVEKTYDVTFDSNGGVGYVQSITLDHIGTVNLPNSIFELEGYDFLCWNTRADGKGVIYKVGDELEVTSDVVLYAQWGKILEDGQCLYSGHNYVNLGLPSGTLWASCNIGAEAPEQYGDYLLCGKDREMSSVINIEDVASINWGGYWRMPTNEEMQELIDRCTWEWSTKNGVSGYTVTGSNGNSIFLPATGLEDGYLAGQRGLYWSSSLDTDDLNYAYCLSIEKDFDDVEISTRDRKKGLAVRPVMCVKSIYGVIFDSNGGDGVMLRFAKNKGENFVIPENEFTRLGYVFTSWNTQADGSGKNYNVADMIYVESDLKLYAQWYKTEVDLTHEYVDLGLSVKWATCNVGAENPEDYGDYFAWGEIGPKYQYSLEYYKWYSYNQYTKYCTFSNEGEVDNKTILELSDDAANVIWGGDWRIPTNEEMQELIDRCTWEWTTKNGVSGYTVTGSNGNSIFLPAAGNRQGSGLYSAGSYGYYWSSSLSTSYSNAPYILYVYSGSVSRRSNFRYFGHTVRPVLRE